MDSKPIPGGERVPQASISAEQLQGGLDRFAQLTPELGVEPMPGERINAANSAVQQAVTAVAIPANQTTQLTIDPQGQSSTIPVIADDNDVIEKEWVDKAKHIVSQTAGDPHLKSKQLTGLKIEYIEKRYGKQLKIANDESDS